MRSFNRELGRYIGVGGFGGVHGGGPVLECTSVSLGYYPSKSGFVRDNYLIDLQSQRIEREEVIGKSAKGWGLDIKYQFLAFLNGKADESGVFLRWGNSLHLAFFQVEYDYPADFPEDDREFPDGSRDKMGLYFETGLGYSIDLGIPNLMLEFQTGIPTVTSLFRASELLSDFGDQGFGRFTDIDDGTLVGMPYFYGFRGTIMI